MNSPSHRSKSAASRVNTQPSSADGPGLAWHRSAAAGRSATCPPSAIQAARPSSLARAGDGPTFALLASMVFLAACGGSSEPMATPSPLSCADSPTPAPDLRTMLECQVAIIGGGVGGLHTAFRLGPELGQDVCLFEKESELGGRIKDVPMDPNDPSSPRAGVGARRVMEGQTVLLNLAEELELTLETPPGAADLINARGAWSFSKESLLSRYPSIPADESGDTETALYDALRFSEARADAERYSDFRAYIRDVVGDEEFAYLHDMSRFRADFEYPLDARGYLDYLDEEWDVCCTPSYPVGGMSRFIAGMKERALADGVRIFTDEPVLELRHDTAGYFLGTDRYRVSALEVVVAIPPQALKWVTGDVADALNAQPETQSLIGVKVATVTQWWPSAWWANISRPDDSGDTPVWRGWTTESCINFIEIPQEPYAAAQNVTRSVYDDDLNCVELWETLAAKGEDAVEAEIRKGLEHLFQENGISEPVAGGIPKALRTYVQIWPDAWHWVRAGGGFTNAQIFDWALEPLAGEEVFMVGEAYNPQRSGWSDAAYKSSINLLNSHFGLSLDDGSSARGSAQAARGTGRRNGR